MENKNNACCIFCNVCAANVSFGDFLETKCEMRQKDTCFCRNVLCIENEHQCIDLPVFCLIN